MIQSVMRTGVPIVYALLIHFGFSELGLGDEAATTVATVIVAAALYVILRLLERLQPVIGVLLGWIGEPKYATEASTTVGHATLMVHTKLGQSLDDALSSLRDDLGSIVEDKVTAALSQIMKPTKVTTGRASAAKKAAAK